MESHSKLRPSSLKVSDARMISSLLSYIWIGLPVGAWLTNLLAGKRIHPALLYLMIVVVGYFVLVASVMALDAELEAKMNSFDLDGDGGIGGSELTPDAEKAMEDWASDTGRSFAPIIGAPLTLIWYSILFGLVFAGEWIVRSLFKKPKSEPEVISDIPPEFESEEEELPTSDNPYRPPSG